MAKKALLERYTNAKIRHPSWRVYKAIEEIKKKLPELKKQNIYDPDELDGLAPQTFGLKENIDIYYPVDEPDDLTNEIIAAIINPNYSDNGRFGIDDCMFIFCDIEGRQLLEGLLMEGVMPGDIAVELDLPVETVGTYASVFYDTSIWRAPGDRIHYIKKGLIGIDSMRKVDIYNNGYDYVATNTYHRQSKVKMEKALANLFGLTYTQIMQGLDSTDPEDAERIQKMTANLINMFKELRNSTKQEGGIRELAIALKTMPAPNKGVDNLDNGNSN